MYNEVIRIIQSSSFRQNDNFHTLHLSDILATTTNQRCVRCHVTYVQPMKFEESLRADATKDSEA